MALVTAFAVALWLSAIAYRLIPIPNAFFVKRIHESLSTEAEPSEPLIQQLLAPFSALAQRFAPAHQLARTEAALFWAKRGGHWRGWQALDVWGLRLALALIAVAYGLMMASPLGALVLGTVAFMWPSLRLNGQAERMKRRLQRDLPEFAQLLALQVATGLDLQQALERLSESEGHTARWIRETLALSVSSSLFSNSDGSLIGKLRERALSAGDPLLINLAVQLDLIHSKGDSARELLNDLADTVASEYNAQVEARANALGDKLVVPVMLFYFLPYMFALLAPLLNNLTLLFVQ